MERHLAKLAIPVYIHDHGVDIGVPEHLERIDAHAGLETFAGFLDVLKQKIVENGSTFSSPATDQFTASIDAEYTLRIEAPAYAAVLSQDGLFGIWITLLNGLLTREKLSWSAGAATDELMQVLALVPGVNSIEIASPKADFPEPALQLHVTPKTAELV